MLQQGQKFATGLRRGIGAMTGADTRTTAEKAADMLIDLDMSNKEDQKKILQLVSRTDPDLVPQLKLAFEQFNREPTTSTSVAQSQRTNSKSGYVICKTVANGETVQEVVWASTCPDGAVTSNSNKSAPVVNTEPEKDEDIDTLTSSQPDNAPQQSYAVRVADCILKDKEDYLSLDWYHENHLRLFTEKFYEIEKTRDKLVFGTPTAKREKDLLKKIGHSKSNALRFLIHAQETGKMHHQAVLLNLLACNGQ
jgi:hypothetical protein